MLDISLEISKGESAFFLRDISHSFHKKFICFALAILKEWKYFLQFRLIGDVIEHAIFILCLEDIGGNIIIFWRKFFNIGLMVELFKDGLSQNIQSFLLQSSLLFHFNLIEYFLVLYIPRIILIEKVDASKMILLYLL